MMWEQLIKFLEDNKGKKVEIEFHAGVLCGRKTFEGLDYEIDFDAIVLGDEGDYFRIFGHEEDWRDIESDSNTFVLDTKFATIAFRLI